jgi:integrase
VQARLTAAALSSFYTWALPRLDRLPANPVKGAGRPPVPAARERVLSEAELRALWKASDAEPFPWRAAIKLLILTGQRRNEVFEADRAEFDFAERTWTIPAHRAKNGKAHIVPLSDAALAVLETVPEIVGKDKLFPSHSGKSERGPSGFSKPMARLRDAVEKGLGAPVEDWRIHDVRRTMATGMQRLGVRLEVTEAVLNHVSGSNAGIVGVYQRHDWKEEKRHALDAWAAEVERIVAGRPLDNVVAFKGAAG